MGLTYFLEVGEYFWKLEVLSKAKIVNANGKGDVVMQTQKTGAQKSVGVYVILEECGDKNYIQLFHKKYLEKETGNPKTKYLAVAIKLLRDWQYYDGLLKIEPESVAMRDFEFDLHRQTRINWSGRVRDIEAEQVKLEIGCFTFCCELKRCDKHPLNEDREEECPFHADLLQVKLENPCAIACGRNSLGLDVQRHLVPIFPHKEHGWIRTDAIAAKKAVLKLN